MEKWAPDHGMTLEEATKKFPEEAGISPTVSRKRSPT